MRDGQDSSIDWKGRQPRRPWDRRRQAGRRAGEAVRIARLNSAITEQIIHERNYTCMRHAKPQLIRNKIDLADPCQIRILKKRLGISADELRHIVEKVGNSIAAVSKEIQLQKAIPMTEPVSVQIEPSEIAVAASALPPQQDVRLNQDVTS